MPLNVRLALCLLLSSPIGVVAAAQATVTGTSVDKPSLINGLRQQKAMIAELVRRCVRIDLQRDSAVVTGVSNATFTMENRETQLVSRYLHLWLRTDGQWQLFARQVTASNADSCEQ